MAYPASTSNQPSNDENGHIGLKDLTDASKLATKRQDTERLRMWIKREWALNRAFYNGQQWSFWNPQMLRVEDLPIDGGPKWKVRLISNQIKPGLHHYVAQLTKTRPVINAEPDSGDDSDVKAAQYAESLYEYLFDELHLNAKLQGALFEAGLSGGYWKITWDPLAGKPMTFTVDPTGKPILDPQLADLYIDQLEQQIAQTTMPPPGADDDWARDIAMKVARKTVYMGEIRVDVMNAENVLLDPAVNTFEDAKWAICKHPMDPDEIEARWGVKVEPNSVRASDTPAPIPYIEDKKPPMQLREVFIMYVRPCPELPKGRYVVWIEGPNEILQDMPWPYPFRELPLVKFPGQYRPNSPYDDSLVTDARTIQKDLNKTLSQIVEHKNLTLRPQMLAPIGSLRQKLTTEPGAIWEFNPVGNMVPQWREMPPLPQYVFEHLNDLQMRIDRIFNRMPSTRDQLPPRTDSGTVLEGMQEAVADQLSTVILGIEDALARAGHIMACLAQQYYVEPRLIKIRGAAGSVQVKKFQGADITGGFTFRPRYGTGLPRTRAGKQMAIMQLVEAQLIDPKTALKHLDLADLKGVQAKLAADEDQALREHDKLLRGQPINQQAMQDTQQQIQQMIQTAQAGQVVVDPSTGNPIDPQMLPQQLQQMMQQAMNAPTQYEDWDAHLEVHSSFMKTSEFESYPPDVQARFIDHFNQTFQRVIDVRKAQMTFDPRLKPKVTVQAKATTSAEVLGEILRQQGVDVSDQDVAQPPLDTWVTDDLTKPNVQESGNTHMEAFAQQLELQQAQDQHMVAMAEAAQRQAASGVSQAQAETQSDLQMHGQAMSLQQQAELHQQKLRHAEEMHQARLKQANRPPAPSKPSK